MKIRMPKKGKYFFLNKNCFLESGKVRSAIYDLDRKRVCGISKEIGDIIKSCAEGISLKQAYYKKMGNNPDAWNVIERLIKQEIGSYSDRYIVSERLVPSWTIEGIAQKTNSYNLDCIWLELTKECNLDCIHCVEKDGSISRCSCSRSNQVDPGTVSLRDWRNLVREADIFGCKEIIIIGGEPLMERRKLEGILKYSENTSINNIKIKSNLILIDSQLISLFKRNDKVVVETTLFAHIEKVHDKITNCPGSWRKLVKTLDRMVTEGIKIRVNLEIMMSNEGYVDDTLMFLKKMGIKDIYISFVHSNRTELWPKRYSDYMLTDYKTIEGIAREEYFSNIERHPCWYGKLAITHDGYILPCIMAKRFIIGTIKRISLKDVMLNKMTKDYWTLTKDKINICKECEYRYSCHDCRPIQSQDGSLFGCNRFCQIPRMERGWLT